MSTPKNDGTFNVYDDIREKLIARGVPAEQVRFIHEATTDAQKKELFGKVRSGEVRVLLGSTPKMGAGTNVQDRLIAIHNLDCPWRPSDLEQRQGRIERQGNMFPEVEVYRYVTEQTFDAYLYQLVESKQKFISQIMTSKTASVVTDVEKAKDEKAGQPEPDIGVQDKAEKDKLLDALMGTPIQKEENAPNPSVAKTEKSPLSEPTSEQPKKSAEGATMTKEKPSVKEELRKIKESRKEQEADTSSALDKSSASDRAKKPPAGKTEHKQPQKRKRKPKSKETR